MGVAELYRVQRANFVTGATAAEGLVIVIDVFRACSLVAVALSRGAERHAKPLPGFAGDNSPSELVARELTGRAIVHTTHAGTQGLTAAYGSVGAGGTQPRVFTGALVDAAATVRLVRDLLARGVADCETVVAMGQSALERCIAADC